MNESKQLLAAVDLAGQLFRLEFVQVDSVNVRLGRFQLGLVFPLRRPEWRVWELDEQVDPIDPTNGTWLDSFEDVDEAMATLVSYFTGDHYQRTAADHYRRQALEEI